MKSTNNHLMGLIGRLTALGILLFICTEIFLAYLFAFHLLPAKNRFSFSKDHTPLRLGVELDQKHQFFKAVEYGPTVSITELFDSYEVYCGFKNGVFDMVKTDQVTARLLVDKFDAVPHAFLFDKENRKVLSERFVLISKDDQATFLEQTKGLNIVFKPYRQDIDHIIISEFLNQRTGGYKKWFNDLFKTTNDFSSLNLLLAGKVDLAVVSELMYGDYLKTKGKAAEGLRVLWYSNPLSKNVIVVRQNLHKEQIKQLNNILEQENELGLSWTLFQESLEDFNEWTFLIRGLTYKHPGFIAESGDQL